MHPTIAEGARHDRKIGIDHRARRVAGEMGAGMAAQFRR